MQQSWQVGGARENDKQLTYELALRGLIGIESKSRGTPSLSRSRRCRDARPRSRGGRRGGEAIGWKAWSQVARPWRVWQVTLQLVCEQVVFASVPLQESSFLLGGIFHEQKSSPPPGRCERRGLASFSPRPHTFLSSLVPAQRPHSCVRTRLARARAPLHQQGQGWVAPSPSSLSPSCHDTFACVVSIVQTPPP